MTVLTWPAPAAELSWAGVDALEQGLLQGFGDAAPSVAASGGAIANLVIVETPGPLASAFAATVAGWGRGLARELAREATTVNTVIAGPGLTARQEATDLANFLAGGDAGFITGQTLGRPPAPAPGAPGPGPEGPGVALVSGGSGDLGAAICRRLLDDGWQVLVGHRPGTDASAVAGEGRELAGTVPLDLVDPDAIGAASSRVGPLDGLVLNAGWTATGPFVDTTPDERLRVLRTNLTGPARLLAALDDKLAPGAVIVGTGSEAGRIGEAGRAVYSGAKAGLAGLLGALVATGRRALTTAPGPYDTELLRATWGDPERAERGIERLRQLVPLRRLGRPEELAAAVAFAMSPAGGALRGEVLSVGGGITMV